MATRLAWGRKVPAEFRERLIAAALRDGYDPSHAMAIMQFESRINPQAVNPQSGATGLIQFMPSTARDLNTTVEALARMTALEQLDFVERYFHRYAGRIGNLNDAYMSVLYPHAIGQPDNFVLFARGSKAYEQNKALDLDGDGNITKNEACEYVRKALAEGMLERNVSIEEDAESVVQPEQETDMLGVGSPDPIKTAASIAGIFNPLAGGLIGLAGEIFKAFSPMLQQKVAKEVNRHTDDPAIGEGIAASLSKMVLDQARALTGETDDFKATAAIIANPEQAANLQKLEASVDASLDKMAKAGDQSIIWDKTMWDAQNLGRQTVSTIAIEEKRAGLYDMTALLARVGSYLVLTATLLMMLTILGQSVAKYVFKIPDAQGIDPVLIAFAAPLVTMAFSAWKDIIAYRFDGTKAMSDQTKALLKVTK